MFHLISELRRHGGMVSKDIVIGRDRCVENLSVEDLVVSVSCAHL